MSSGISPEFWRGRPVLITGATGLLGGWLVDRLLGLGAEVTALVRDGVPRSMLVRNRIEKRINIFNGSVEDPAALHRAMTQQPIDTVLHLAAQPIVGVAKIDAIGTFRTNIEGTWNVLEAARVARARQVVIASSEKVYGPSSDLPYTEDHPLQGRFPYDTSKSCADLIAQTYLATYDMPLSIVRCANIFGGGDLNFDRAIPGVIRATLEGVPFVIRSDGKFVRDFLYVEDAADAYLHLVQSLANGAPQGPYNFSLESRLTVLDCVTQVLDIMERQDLVPVILNQAGDEVREHYMTCDKARQLLGWSPRVDMAEGLRRTIDWYSSYFAAAPQLALNAR